jgi:hypothetical protein
MFPKEGRHCPAFIFYRGGKTMKQNGFEEMVAIQLAVRSWPGQAKLSAEDLGLKDGEVPEIFYLGNKKLYPQEWRQLFSQLSSRARSYLNDHSYPFVVEVRQEVA